MTLEVVKGPAAAVRHAVHVSGDRDGVSTKHHATFRVGETTVVFASGAPPIIEEGDRLTVAGRRRGRVLLAEAYRNDTAGVRGDTGLWLNFAGMACGLLAGAAGLGGWLLNRLGLGLPDLNETFLRYMVVGGALSAIFGLYCLYAWLRVRGAVRLVRGG